MIKFISTAVCFILTTNALHSQSKRYVATAIMKSSIVNYVHAIDSNIVLIDFMKIKKSKRKENFDKVSGLILSGGRDVHPSTYGRKDSLKLCVTHKKRDEVELYMIKEALKDSLPILGICRGHQILNASLNGDLYQDIPSEYKTDKKVVHRDPAEREYVYHPIELEATSELLRLYGKAHFEVNSFHNVQSQLLLEGQLLQL